MMAGFIEFLESEGYEQFKKANFLSKEASKNDPEDQPYKSFYEAREILSDLRIRINEIRNGEDPNSKDLLLALACVDLHLGCNYTDTDETSAGEECLLKVLESLEEMKMEDGAVSIYLHALNNLGVLWSARSRHDKAKDYLDQAENLFHEYKKNVGDAPRRADEFFQKREENESESDLLRHRASKFEATHTHTLYYKAQILAKLGDDIASAKYCHTTLHRQLESNEYDATDWALNAATLSQVYITQEKFPLARHCLASSSVIFQEMQPDGEASEEARENWDYKDADIRRCWIKYGLQLLEVSKDKMMEQVQTFDQDHGMDDNSDENPAMADHNYDKRPESEKEKSGEDGEEKSFEPFNIEVTSHEEKVTDKLVKTFEEARQVFLFIQEGVTRAKKMYTLDGNCSDFIELTQDHSKAFKLLAFFELDMERQCRMHKRRVDMLQALLNEVSQQHYLLVCRQLLYEVAETYSSMLDIKLSMIEMEAAPPTPHAARKINSLAHQSIQQYQAYLETLKGGKPDLPETFPDGNTRPALIAMFCCGRLWGKILSPQVNERLVCMKRSMECYKFVVDYCRRHPEAKAEVEKELVLCKELSALLPIKMEKIRGEHE
ncbi:KIF-binding protein-like [Babylonia areolata]|uniref:KIF-binding protein-like n=1 Tax=Babylonia areolata TaxID=304850 RepID=UPI003FCF4865